MPVGAVGIRAIDYYLPPRTETLAELKAKGLIREEVHKLKMLGYDRVHLSEEESAYEMALRVGRQLLARNLVDPAEVDILVCGHTLTINHLATEDTVTLPFADQFKFSGLRLQHELGLANASVFGLSQLTCTSFMTALRLVDAIIANDPRLHTAMIICADRFPPSECREIAFTVLSDGSCAALVCRNWSENRPIAFNTITKGYLWDWDRQHKDMATVFYPTMIDTINATLRQAGITLAEVALIVPINISMLSWQVFAQLTGYPSKCVFTDNVPRFAHAMSCDSAINLSDALSTGRVKPNEHILLIAQGLGAHWGSVLLEH